MMNGLVVGLPVALQVFLAPLCYKERFLFVQALLNDFATADA